MPLDSDYNILKEAARLAEAGALDIRTLTLGLSLRGCSHQDAGETEKLIFDKISRLACRFTEVRQAIEQAYSIPIVNLRLSVSPVALIYEGESQEDYLRLAEVLDRAAGMVGANFLGGFSALVQKGCTRGDRMLLDSLPRALAATERVCASVNVATTRAGINMEAVELMGQVIKKTAELTASRDGIGCARLVVFCNTPEDNPFMAGAFHGPGEPECSLNVGVSGPGAILSAVRRAEGADLGELSARIREVAYLITRAGELVGREAARRLGVPFGVIDLSLAPTPSPGRSVAEILEAMGLERCGTHGSTAALALLNDALKRGGAMATSAAGGLSGTFLPVSEDRAMAAAAAAGTLSIDKLESLTSVCSVGLDMVAIPGDTPAETISALIADEAAIGLLHNKTTAVRVIPVPGKRAGDHVFFGGLLGEATVLPLHQESAAAFIQRGGRFPAPLQSLTN